MWQGGIQSRKFITVNGSNLQSREQHLSRSSIKILARQKMDYSIVVRYLISKNDIKLLDCTLPGDLPGKCRSISKDLFF